MILEELIWRGAVVGVGAVYGVWRGHIDRVTPMGPRDYLVISGLALVGLIAAATGQGPITDLF